MNKILTIILIFITTYILNASEVILDEIEKEWIKKHPLITLGSDLDWAPFIIKNNGEISGYDKDILDLINKKTGANFQLKAGNWDEIVNQAIKKQIDGISTSSISKQRAKYFNFSDTYVTTQKYLYILNQNVKNIKNVNDLKGLKIAYKKGNLFDEKLLSQYKDSIIIPLNTLEEKLESLVNGKVDVIIGNHEILAMAIKEKLPYLKIIDRVANSKLELVFSLRKDYPEAITILNKGLKAISKEEKQQLDKKWFFESRYIEDKNQDLNLTKEEKKYLENKKTLTVSNIKTLPPFNFFENGKEKGYSIDYMRIVEKYLDVKIEFIKDKSWDEYMQMLKNHEIDLIPHVAVTDKRKEYLAFTNFNHIQYNIGIAVHKNTTISSMDEMKNKVIAVVKNSFIESYFKRKFPQYNLLLVSSTAKAVEELSLGKADIAIGSLPGINYYIQKNWLSNIKTIKIDDFGISLKVNLPMAVAKDNQILKSILEKVDSLINHNEIVKLKQKWMNIIDFEYKNNEFTQEELRYLQNKDRIKMCVLPDWLPFEQIDEKGNHRGIGADIMKIISRYINKPIELVKTKSWENSLENIKNKECDILPMAVNLENRTDSMNFTKPYIKEPFVIATKMDKLFVKDAKSLSGKKIAVRKNYAFAKILLQNNPNIKIYEVKSTKEGLEKVSNEEFYGYVDTMPTIGYAIQKYAMYDLKIAGKLEFDVDLSIASRNDEALLNSIMQKALNSISEDQKRTIIGKWIEIKVEQVFNYTLLFQITGALLFIILVVLYKNRAISLLNKEIKNAKNEIEEQHKMVDKYVLILSTDTKGIITDVNEAFCKSIGYKKEDLIGFNHSSIRCPNTESKIFSNMWEKLNKNEIWTGEITNIKKDKTKIVLKMNIEPIYKDGIKIGYRSISEDITDKKRIEELSVTDKLTGLYNRLKLDEMMLIKIEKFRRYKVDFSIILIDIDNFKEVNDNYGHDVGDYILKELAKLIKDNIRITDIAGRWGGEEFLIICNNTNLENANVLAEKIRQKVEKKSFDKVKNKTISLGLTQFKESDDFKTIFKRADESLYKAKNTGKNKTVAIK